MKHLEKNSPAFPTGGMELARRQAQTLHCGFSPMAMRTVAASLNLTGLSWAINANRETGKARGAGAFPFRIATATTA